MSRSALLRYVLRRALAGLSVILVVSAVTFLFIHLSPGGPEESIAGRDSTPAQREAIRASYGLDRPIVIQYSDYLTDAARLDFGDSILTREPVTTAIGDRLPISAPLILGSFGLICIIGITLGTMSAYKRGGGLDRFFTAVSITGASAPAFATAVILIYVFGVRLGWFPTFGDGEGFRDRLHHLVLPIVSLTLVGVASMLKLTRARVSQVLREDHVTFAQSRGMRPSYILFRDVLHNSGVAIITQSGIILLALISGGVLIEVTFGLNGVGALLVRAIQARDIPVIQAIVLLITVFIVAVNLIVDLAYFVIDPRMRDQFERSAA